MLQKGLPDTDKISIDFMEAIFENYGDDYYKDYGSAPFTLQKENLKRRKFLTEVEDEI